MNFYSTTLFIFLILLILILAYIAYTLAFPDDVQYPPIVANCPDYWVNSKSQNGDPQCELPIELQSEYKLLTGKKTFSSRAVPHETVNTLRATYLLYLASTLVYFWFD